jgi:hypothetical protein
MQGGGPSNAFGQPKPTTPTLVPGVGVPGANPPPPDDEKRYIVTEDPVASSSSPRIGLEPTKLPITFGSEQVWRVVGMELDGLATESIDIFYDTSTLGISEVALGSAIIVDPLSPPSITVDREAGRIKVVSTDATQPLRFGAGGEVLLIKVRGLAPGDGFAMLEGLVLRGSDGRRTPVVLAGGRSRVE